MKEKFLSHLKTLLFGKIRTEDIPAVLDSIVCAMQPYELTEKEQSLVLYDHGDEKIVQQFFVAKAVEGLSKNSLTYYFTILRCFFRDTGKHIKDMDTESVRLYLARKKLDKSSDATMNNIRRVLSSFFTWCLEEDLIERNPMLRIKGIRQVKKLKKPLTDDDMELLRSTAKTRRNRAIIEFLFSTGCRLSEMIGANRDDVDFVNGQIDVLGKGRKYRTVYLSSRCKTVLKDYLDSRTDNLEALFISDWEGFINPGGLDTTPRRIGLSAVGLMLRNLGKRAGISNVHAHRFRRTAATTALHRGMPIEQVQRMLGHESIQTTTIYALSTDDELKLSHKKYIN
jgi:site-specific recombinase XerD